MGDAVSPVDVGDDHAIAGGHAPGAVCPTAEDVPLIFQAADGIQHHPIAASQERLVQGRLRWNGLGHGNGPLHLGQAAKFPGDTLRVGIRREVQGDETREVWNRGTSLLRDRLRLRRLRLGDEKTRFGALEPMILEDLVQPCEIHSDRTCDLRTQSPGRGHELRPYTFAELDLDDARLKCVRRNGAWGQIARPEANGIHFILVHAATRHRSPRCRRLRHHRRRHFGRRCRALAHAARRHFSRSRHGFCHCRYRHVAGLPHAAGRHLARNGAFRDFSRRHRHFLHGFFPAFDTRQTLCAVRDHLLSPCPDWKCPSCSGSPQPRIHGRRGAPAAPIQYR